jgi:hypothetical protein
MQAVAKRPGHSCCSTTGEATADARLLLGARSGPRRSARPIGVAVVDATDELTRGRDAYVRRTWMDAYKSLSHTDETAPLGAEDLELLATSAYMLSRDDDYLSYLERAHHAYLDAGEAMCAVRCGFWVGVNLALRGEMARATGWFGWAQRLLGREGRDCVERGYLLLPEVLQRAATDDHEGAYATAADAAEIGERFGDRVLFALAVHEHGRALVRQGRVEVGFGLLDEAMVAVIAGELSPIVTGMVYCSVIMGCQEVYELRRAQEWTAALTQWCEQQPDMVAFTGRCLGHRAEMLELHGAWRDALEEAQWARQRCEQVKNQAAAAQAFYLQGRFIAYGGSSPQPRRHTGTRAGTGANRSRVWPCCGWPRGTTTLRPGRSVGWWARAPSR